MFTMQGIVLVFAGGGLGAVARFVLTTMIGGRFATVFPFGTLFVNLVGSFLMGFVMMLALHEHFVLPESVRLLFVVGFLGGFTTFSSFSMETMLLFAGTDIFYALSNIAANMGAGLFAVWLGMCLARGV